jgi:hypothetical protein
LRYYEGYHLHFTIQCAKALVRKENASTPTQRSRKSKESKEHFTDIQNREDGNLAIINVYLDGYAQSSSSRYLNILKPLVLKVIKR